MIYNSSIIDGFKAIIGTPPIHAAMLLTLLIAIPIPRDDNDERNDKATALYFGVLANHTFLTIIGVLTLGIEFFSHAQLNLLNIIGLCVSLFVALWIGSNWVFDDDIAGQKIPEQWE